ncbi:WYL domain-containing protein [Duganella sp. BJB488]|uniref:helix-turn-helix transcriptional regulator n=1 Tax=unclassified Duganella TaxID=2636909 RepID=UPI000E34BDF3|nr:MULTISPECIES: WYL domain-containing protein [unclassified Duganella]RFP26162.1 WYL domain-containing protein [Duganella sp. BJB489]RFP28099.1 WYL domain-containing protein [Duganella sp. BJB488]RFP37090.1 WYL domain-containing protein [Duganella sp. BJB480]
MSSINANHSRGEKLAQRLSRILARLHQGDRIDKHQLADEHGVDVRTIERDLGERLLGIAERNPEGHWQLTHAARSTIPARHLHGYARLSGTEHLFPDSSLRYLLEQLDTPESRRATLIQAVPQEDLKGGLFTALQAAIEHCHLCRFSYKGRSRVAQPYRLIHKDGIWYLAAEEGERLKSFSIGLIEGMEVDVASRFHRNPAHVDYIDAKNDVWFTTESTDVLLRVAPEVAHYFSRQQLLPHQQQRMDSDGSLLVTAQINHINQLLPVVRHWLPHVRIIRPLEWHEVLLQSLRQALQMWEG